MKGRNLSTAEQRALALTHPLAAAFAAYLEQHDVACPRDAARALNVRVENLAYHVRKLRDLGIIELADQQQVRGAIAHYYRLAAARPPALPEPLQTIADRCRWANMGYRDGNAGGPADIAARLDRLERNAESYARSLTNLHRALDR